VQRGYTVTNSIIRKFSYGMYLGGHDTIARNVFEDNGQVPGSAANGYDIYSDFVYTAHDTSVTDNVFKNPLVAGVLLQGDANRGSVVGGEIARNAFLKKVNSNVAAFVTNTSGVVIKDNLFWRPSPVGLPTRGDSAIRLDKVNAVQITGNTITGWGAAISIGDVGTPGPPGSTDVTAAFNRIYDNRYGVKVTPVTLFGSEYAPLEVNATDNWWGANGGPGSAGARPGGTSPVNGVQFLTTTGAPVPSQPGIRVDRSLQLTCSAPATVQTNVPVAVAGQVLRMPTVSSTASKPPWFLDRADPLMAASAPDVGDVFGFGRVPDEGPENAQLTGTLLPTTTGTGEFLVDLDSERVACPLTVTAGPDAIIGKDADSPTVAAGGLAGYRVTIANRGKVTARNWWACDRIPRRMTFVRASSTLRRLGRLRCLVIPTLRPHQRVSFHITLRVAAHTPNTTLTNIAEVLPGLPAGGAAVPGGTPPTVSEPPQVGVPIGRDKVKVRVLARPPSVTG